MKGIRVEAAFWKAQAAQAAQATLLNVRFFAHFWLESESRHFREGPHSDIDLSRPVM